MIISFDKERLKNLSDLMLKGPILELKVYTEEDAEELVSLIGAYAKFRESDIETATIEEMLNEKAFN